MEKDFTQRFWVSHEHKNPLNLQKEEIAIFKYFEDMRECVDTLLKLAEYKNHRFVVKTKCPNCHMMMEIDIDNETWICDECDCHFSSDFDIY